jgi:hypothetical protein
MKCDKRHILLLLGGMLMLLLTACSSSEENEAVKEQPTVITFYVYAPDRPLPTRAGDDQVNASTAESIVNSLQIWVFTHDETNQDNDGKLVGYLSPKEMPSGDGTVYQMEVSKDFANAAPDERPHVDVYVAANTAAVGLPLSLGMNSSRDVLDAAYFGNDDFGVSAPCSTISDNGLPMSGVLRNQVVKGENPVLRIGNNYDDMAKVQLQRAVSKIRFVFSQQKGGAEELTITGVTLHGKVGNVDYGFPNTEYLFLGDKDYHIGNDYAPDVTTILSPSGTPLSDIPESNDPADYIYDTSVFATAQKYEEKIDDGLKATDAHAEPELKEVGPFYFRETDKILRGTIDYKIGEVEQHKDFSMESQSNFYRNHSWIVYAFYGSSGLDVLTVYVNEWTTNQQDHSFYNW